MSRSSEQLSVMELLFTIHGRDLAHLISSPESAKTVDGVLYIINKKKNFLSLVIVSHIAKDTRDE